LIGGLCTGLASKMQNISGTYEELIAPCGMNCEVCSAYLALKSNVINKGIRMAYSTSCRPRDKRCAFLKKRCDLLLGTTVKYCYECKDFPCPNLEHLDRRYRTFHKMSMVENLEYIEEKGPRKFLAKEKEKWKRPKCDGIICCHNGICFNCGLEKLKMKKKLHRWENN